jgi:hypothetical protein
MPYGKRPKTCAQASCAPLRVNGTDALAHPLDIARCMKPTDWERAVTSAVSASALLERIG